MGPHNGGLSVLRGLHRRGCFPRVGASEPRLGFFDPSHNIDPQELPDEQALLELQTDYALDAGTVAVHDVMLPHAVSPSRSFAVSTHGTRTPLEIDIVVVQSLPNRSSEPRRAFNLRFCSAEGLLGGDVSYDDPLRPGESRPREFILLCGEDAHGRGFGRQPSWRGGSCYTGEAGVDTGRHGRPAGEAGGYALTSVHRPPKL